MSAQSIKLAISPAGTITAIYSDDLAGLIELGAATIKRVSDVEPDANGHWWATMRDKCGHLGPVGQRAILRHDYTLQMGPFKLRSEALAAEVEYLESRLFGAGVESRKSGVSGIEVGPENAPVGGAVARIKLI